MTQDELNAKLRYYFPGYVVDKGLSNRQDIKRVPKFVFRTHAHENIKGKRLQSFQREIDESHRICKHPLPGTKGQRFDS